MLSHLQRAGQTDAALPELSVVVLAYRAGEGLGAFVDELRRSLETDPGAPPTWEVILVANHWPGSGDKTPEVARRLAAADTRLRVVSRAKRGAMGWDLRSGLAETIGNHLAFTDGDGQVQAGDVVAVYRLLRERRADLAKTYRQKRADGTWRRLVSHVYNALFRGLFPGLATRDINAKPKVFTRNSYERMHLEDDGWFIDAEIMIQARRLGLTVIELPTTFLRQETRASFVRPVALLEFIFKLLRAAWRERHYRRR